MVGPRRAITTGIGVRLGWQDELHWDARELVPVQPSARAPRGGVSREAPATMRGAPHLPSAWRCLLSLTHNPPLNAPHSPALPPLLRATHMPRRRATRQSEREDTPTIPNPPSLQVLCCHLHLRPLSSELYSDSPDCDLTSIHAIPCQAPMYSHYPDTPTANPTMPHLDPTRPALLHPSPHTDTRYNQRSFILLPSPRHTLHS